MHTVQNTAELTALLDRTEGSIDIEAPDGVIVEIHQPRVVRLRRGAAWLVNHAVGGKAVNYAKGGWALNHAEGGTAVNFAEGGAAVNYGEGGRAVNYAEGGRALNHAEDGEAIPKDSGQ